MVKYILRLVVLVSLIATGLSRSVPILRQDNQENFIQQNHVDILEDVKDGPFWDGSYYFRYSSADGTVREEGGRNGLDGSFVVTGSYGFNYPNGERIDMQYISDINGYRVFPAGSRGDFVPPQRVLDPGPPPTQNFISNNLVETGNIKPLRPVTHSVTLNNPPLSIQPALTSLPLNLNINARPTNTFSSVNKLSSFNRVRPAPGTFQAPGSTFQGLRVNRSSQDVDVELTVPETEENVETESAFI